MVKPSVFIGSSVEGKGVAEAIQLNLEYDVTSTIWHQGVFGLSSNTLQSLVSAVKDFDFAVLVLTPDDMVTKRGESFSVPRDNLLFELGLFMGYLGPERTFAIHPRDQPINLPTDLAGVATATYQRAERQTLQSALGPACTKIKTAITAAPPQSRLEGDSSSATVYSELRELRSMVATILESIGGRHPREKRTQGDAVVALLAGAWKNVENESMLYCRSINREAHTVYCYGGNDHATGEYFSWRIAGDELVGRFRWFSNDFDGYVWLRKTNQNLLEGGWWYSESIDPHSSVDPARLKKSKSMQRSTWKRVENAAYPQWAEDYFSGVQRR